MRILAKFLTCLCIFVFSKLFEEVIANSCQINGRNFSALSINSPWTVWNGSHGKLEVSLCAPLSPDVCGANASVCYSGIANDTRTVYGKYREEDFIATPQHSGEFKIQLQGGKCPVGGGDVWTSIYFKCGKSLGFPEFLESGDSCGMILEWETLVACKEGTRLARIEATKCFGFDAQRSLVDLEPLDGEYDVNVTGVMEGVMKVAVCRNMDSGHTCPGSAACLVHANGSKVGLGRIVAPLGGNAADGFVVSYVDDQSNLLDCRRVNTTVRFSCPQDRVGSEPRLESYSDCTFVVVWQTEVACPVQTTTVTSSCFLSTSKHNISLASLASDEPYRINTTDGAGDAVDFRFHVCSDRLISCGKFLSSACQENLANQNIKSVGNFSDQKLRYSDGKLQMVMGGGEPCGTGFKRNTVINFICDKKAGAKGDPEFAHEDACTYVFHWNTSLACIDECSGKKECTDDDNNNNSGGGGGGRNYTEYENCTVLFDGPERVFRLERLMNRTFDVVDGARNIKLAVCGEVSECEAGAVVCRTEGQTPEMLVTSEGRSWGVTPNGSLQLQLVSDKSKFVVRLVCDEEDFEDSVRRVESSSDSLTLELSTNVVCLDQRVTCHVTDGSGNKYDLSPLAKVNGGWFVQVPGGDSIEINVCRTLSSSSSSSSKCKSAGACLKKATDEVVDAGHVTKPLEVTAPGMLRILYTGGDPCGGDKKKTSVLFHCSAISHGPVLLSSSVNECELIVQWYTPLACPSKALRTVGSDCRVNHPLYLGQTFDLSPLKNKNYEVNFFDEGEYLISVCSGLQDGVVCGDTKAGACLVLKGESVNMGIYNDALVYEEGKLTLTYSATLGATPPAALRGCAGRNVSTSVDFKCEHDNPGLSSGPVYVSGSCNRHFEWITSLACFKYREVPCRVKDAQGNEIDLTHLMLHDSNYEVESDRSKFIINVCSTLVHGSTDASRCPPDSTACRIDKTTGESFSIGKLPDERGPDILKMDGRSVRLEYRGSGSTSTIIHFMCDPNAPETTTPKFLVSEGSSTFVFTWTTRFVCMKVSGNLPNNCSAEDSETGHLYDLSPLRSASPYQVKKQGHTFNISVCSCGTFGVDCPSDGSAPWSLNYEHGAIFLSYPGGQACSQSGKKSNTLVSFVCPIGDETEGVEFVLENEDCFYVFRWKTNLVCKKEMKCLAQGVGAKVYNLSPLIKHDGTYSARISDKQSTGVVEVLINVCTRIQGELGCAREAAACIKTPEGKFVNGGQSEEEPKYDRSKNEVTLTYTGGDDCGGDGRKWSTRITFVCSSRTEANPVLIGADRSVCLYTLQWETKLVCNDSTPAGNSFRDDCKFSIDDEFFDFTNLSRRLASSEMVIPSQKGGSFLINLCSNVSSVCPSSAVCLIDQSRGFGDKNEMKILKEGEDIKFFYDGGPCSKDAQKNSTSSLIFECDRQSKGAPVRNTIFEGNCSMAIIIKSHLACPTTVASQPTPTTTTLTLPEVTPPQKVAATGHGSMALYAVLGVVLACILFAIIGILLHIRKRNHRDYQPINTMHSWTDDEDMGESHSPNRERNITGLQNYASDDDLML